MRPIPHGKCEQSDTEHPPAVGVILRSAPPFARRIKPKLRPSKFRRRRQSADMGAQFSQRISWHFLMPWIDEDFGEMPSCIRDNALRFFRREIVCLHEDRLLR
jgi:hypothetical protein